MLLAILVEICTRDNSVLHLFQNMCIVWRGNELTFRDIICIGDYESKNVILLTESRGNEPNHTKKRSQNMNFRQNF